MRAREPVLTAAELNEFLADVFPQAASYTLVEAVGPMTARARVRVDERHLRPGGTVSGPTIFTAADVGFYAAVLAMIGREPLTLTTNLSINFMRRPERADLIAEARILKLGRTLAVGDALIYSDGAAAPVASASVTYAIPPAAPSEPTAGAPRSRALASASEGGSKAAPKNATSKAASGGAARVSGPNRPKPPRRRKKLG